MKKNNYIKLLKFLGLISFSGLAVSCTVGNVTDEFSKQAKILESSQAKNYFYDNWLNQVIATNFENVEPNKVDEKMLDFSTVLGKLTWNAFSSYQFYNMQNDSNFWLKKKTEWENQGLSQLDNSYNFLPIFDQQINKKDFEYLFKNSLITNLKNSIKELIVIANFLNKNFSEKDDKNQLWGISDKATLDLINTSEKEQNYYLMRYLLSKKPIEKWEFDSSDNSLLSFAKFIKIKNIDQYNSLFEKNNLGNISKNLNQAKIKIADNIDSSKINGYKGIEFTSIDSNNLSFNLNQLLKESVNLAGFWDQKTNKINTNYNLENWEIFKKAKLKNIQIRESAVEQIIINDSNLFSFVGSDLSKINDGDFTYQIISARTSGQKESWITIEISSVKNENKKYFYSVKMNWANGIKQSFLDENFLANQPDFTSLNIDQNTKKISLAYISKIAPNFKTENNKLTFSMENTPWNDNQQINKLSFLFALKDPTLIKSAKKYWVNRGFYLQSDNKIVSQKISELEVTK